MYPHWVRTTMGLVSFPSNGTLCTYTSSACSSEPTNLKVRLSEIDERLTSGVFFSLNVTLGTSLFLPF